MFSLNPLPIVPTSGIAKSPITTVEEGTRVELPGRDPRLPAFYLVSSHPLVPPERRPRKIYVCLQDTTPEAMEDYYRYLADANFPEGTDAGVAAAGFLPLYPGDYVLMRDIHGDGRPENDSMQLWVMAESLIPGEYQKAMDDAREAALGPREDRTPDKPTLVDGVYQGGTLWERHRRAVHVSTSERCYTLVQSYQAPRNLVGPSAGVKIAMDEEPDDHILLREKIIKAAMPLAIACLEAGCDKICHALKVQAEVTNLPRVGYEGNYAFPTAQFNISSTKLADALALPQLKIDLGGFGGKHIDDNDSAGGVTCMITYSDLDESDHPGYFMVGDLGVAIAQRGLVVTCFCGLRFHGGFPPTSPPGCSPKPWSYRFVIVCYPPRAMMDGSALQTFAALPGGRFLYMPPEYIDPHFDDAPIISNIASWITSGAYLTSPAAFLQHYYQTMCQLMYHLARQVPDKAKMRVDFKKLAECFSMVDDSGATIQPDFWELHPGSTARSSTLGCTRKEAAVAWDEHKLHQGRFIPHVVHSQLGKKKREEQQSGQKRKRASSDVSRSEKRKKISDSKRRDKANGHGHGGDAAGTKKRKAPSSEEDYDGDVDDDEEDRGPQPPRKQRKLGDQASLDNNRDLMSSDECSLSEGPEELEDDHSLPEDDVPSDGNGGAANSEGPLQVPARRPHFQPVLDIFGLDNLRKQLRVYETLAESVEQGGHQAVTHKSIQAFMKAFSSGPSSPQLLPVIAQMWPSHAALARSSDLVDLKLRLHRRQLMLCSAAAWYWLTQYCASRCKAIVQNLISNGGGDAVAEEDDWLTRLCHAVYSAVCGRRQGNYDAGDFLEHLKGLDVKGHVQCPRKLEEDYAPRVCSNVLRLLRDWLAFPNNTEMLRAYFVMYVVGSFRNSDVLLLDGVWKVYREVKASVLGVDKKHRYLQVHMLDPFGAAVRRLPLATAGSQEADIMSQISHTLERCAPGIRSWTDSFITGIITGTPSRVHHASHPSASSPSTTPVHSQPLNGPSSPQSRSVPAPSHSQSQSAGRSSAPRVRFAVPAQETRLGEHPPNEDHPGLGALLAFLNEQLPIARRECLRSPTRLQRATMENPDHYLAFRNLGTSRLRVTSPEGPFHKNNIDAPGAFASCLIARALLFDSEVLHHHTYCYFPDKKAWDAFVAAQDYNQEDEASVKRFFNDACYGTPQAQRGKAMEHVESYFNNDEKRQKAPLFGDHHHLTFPTVNNLWRG
ncbi:hypothetical protein OH76DRAFT_1489674 [Lentinus brumalis]|uniref:Uncharacterized protein n=1 Tax=Lentinus brumalis TaxID=2498619 RepID=A0A371CLM1_9APHY|nr:hypothetical protein OH76DRAFT_1489674 [Polyporus brumalis]